MSSALHVQPWWERVAARVPDPVTIFVCLSAVTVAISIWAAARGWGVHHPTTGEWVPARSLLAPESGATLVERHAADRHRLRSVGHRAADIHGGGLCREGRILRRIGRRAGAAGSFCHAHAGDFVARDPHACRRRCRVAGADAARRHHICRPDAIRLLASPRSMPAFPAATARTSSSRRRMRCCSASRTKPRARWIRRSSLNIGANLFINMTFAVVVIAIVTFITDRIIEPRLRQLHPHSPPTAPRATPRSKSRARSLD